MRHKPIKTRHARERYPYPYKAILSALANRDVDPSVGPPHSPSLTGLLLMRHKPIKTRHAREMYPHPYKACFVPLSNRCGILHSTPNGAQRPRWHSIRNRL
ncbi:hypothetical protein PIB30_037815 [Stylosanthes scabra]|uniref:Uncharacterized protein n=1 Tax=Stylosanthes scabra TaxID=79078 RepID=A0ABU6QDB0_9FABA|nr:hypothetical protein [Stylosanthes scabra]